MTFIAFIVVSTVLLLPPWASRAGRSVSLIDALFTATSAVCVTGLTTVPTSDWSTAGQVVILVGIKVGGIGIMTIAALLSLIVSRRLGLTQRLLAASETRTGRLGEVGSLVRVVVVTSLSIEAIIAVVLIGRFAYLGQDLGEAVWHGVFYAVSTFNNAGFVPNAEGLVPFAGDPIVLLPIMIGVFIGALGFPILRNIATSWRRPSTWTLTTKLTLTMAVALLLLSTVMIGLVEWSNPATFGALNSGETVLNIFFHGTMGRSGGFSTVDIGQFDQSTLLSQDALMFVGGGPGSTAGGIKVTTLAVMLLAIRAEARGDRDIEAFGRRISPSVLRVAITVSVASFVIIFIATLMLLPLTPASTANVLFESISAYATCGLSTGLSATLPWTGKLILAVLMLAGRLGTVTLAAAVSVSSRRRVIRLPSERPIVG
jgi:Trk-type K+ transport system membrane component